MILSRELLPSILSAYGFEPKNLQMIYNGTNKIFKLEANDTCLALKLFNKKMRTARQIKYERRLMNYLVTNGVSCTKPIEPTEYKGEQIYTYLGQPYYGILTEVANGAIFTHQASPAQLPIFGGELYKLHNCQQPNFPHPPAYLSDATQLVRSLKPSAENSNFRRMSNLILKLLNNIQTHPTVPVPSKTLCICHGDAWPGNAIYSEKSCILLDFEYSRVSDPSFDASTFLWWALDQQNEQAHVNFWKLLKVGYGNKLDTLLDQNTLEYIKINELRNLVFICNHIPVTDEIFEFLQKRTLWLLKIMPSGIKDIEVLGLK